MPPAAARNTQKRPGDLTGVRGQQLAKEAAEQKAQLATEVEKRQMEEAAQKRAQVVDYTGDQTKKNADVVEVGEVEVKAATRRIRVNYPIEDMTFGREILQNEVRDENGVIIVPAVLGNLRKYSFEEGRRYDVPAELAEHLAFLGYVYDE